MRPLFNKWPELASMRSPSVPKFPDRARHFGVPDSPDCTPGSRWDRSISSRVIEVTFGRFESGPNE
jgi:hypothetical protein